MAVIRGENSKVKIFKVISSLSETWEGEMKPGMSVLGRVVVERLPDVPMVDRRAVRFDGEAYWLAAGGDGDRDAAGPWQVHPVARNAGVYVLDEARDAAVLRDLGLEGEDAAVASAGGAAP